MELFSSHVQFYLINNNNNNNNQVHGAYSAKVSKTVFHLQHQLVPRQSSQTPTDQIERLVEGMTRCTGGQHTSKSPTMPEQRVYY